MVISQDEEGSKVGTGERAAVAEAGDGATADDDYGPIARLQMAQRAGGQQG